MGKLHVYRNKVVDFIGLNSIEMRLAEYLEQEAPCFTSKSPASPTLHKEHSV